MDQKIKFGGAIGYGNSYLEINFCHYNVFKLYAILHIDAGVVLSFSGKSPGYCYMAGRGPNSCLHGHLTGLFICLYVKLFLPSNLN